MAAKLIYDRYITVGALLIPDETAQPFIGAGLTLGKITKYFLAGPAKGDGRPIGREFD